MVKRYESELAAIAMTRTEATSAAAECLSELHLTLAEIADDELEREESKDDDNEDSECDDDDDVEEEDGSTSCVAQQRQDTKLSTEKWVESICDS